MERNVLYTRSAGGSFEYSKGELNETLVEKAVEFFQSNAGDDCSIHIDRTCVTEPYNVADELEKYKRADLIVYQSPTHSMGLPWEAKKWADEVWTAGMKGALTKGDGRSRTSPQDGYGSGGTLQGKMYMLSVTFNAPRGAFDRPDQYLLQGKSVDDLWFPFHVNNRFFGLQQIPDSTFAVFDVMKNPTIEEDLDRYEEHLANLFNRRSRS